MQVVGVHSFNNDDNYMHTEYMQLFLDDIKEEDTLIQKEKQKKINSIAVVLVTICLV